MGMDQHMLGISKETAEHYTWGEGCEGWHLVKSAELSVIHERMPAGTAEVRHYHGHARQFFFILSGTASFQLGEQSMTLTAQQGIEVPPTIVHQIRNSSSEPIEFLVISQPSTRGDRVTADERKG